MPICPKGHDSAATDYCDECGSPIGGLAGTAVTADPTQAPVVASPDPSLDGYGSPCPSCQTPRAGRFCEVCGHDFATEAFASPATSPLPTVSPVPTSGAPINGAAVAAPPQPSLSPQPSASPQYTVPPQSYVPPQYTMPPQSSPSQSSTPSESATAPQSATSPQSAVPSPSGQVTATGQPGAPAGSTVEGGTWRVAVVSDRAFYDRMLATIGFEAEEIPFPPYCPERRFDLVGTEVLIGRSSRSRGITPQIDLTGPPLDPAVSHSHAVLRADTDGWTLIDLESGNGTYINDATSPIGAYVATKVTVGDRIHLGAWTTLTLLRE